MGRIISLGWVVACLLIGLASPAAASAQGGCPRPGVGTEAKAPPDLFSSNGLLQFQLNYQTGIDSKGRTLFCFVTPDGAESPTLHVNPGDTVKIALTNALPQVPGGPEEQISDACGDSTMTLTSVNMHFHGMNVTPACHGDEVIHTLINSGETFDYTIKIPKNEPPGLYWYHPHIHGISSAAVQGGASGAIVVEGIEKIQPAVSGLPERLLIIRDQPLASSPLSKPAGAPRIPNWDVSVNYVSVPYPNYPPAFVKMQQGGKEFWRVANAGANTILDLQVMYDGQAQPLQIVGFDGVPTGSQDGKRQGTIVTQNDVLVPPAGRVEFIIAAPSSGVHNAQLVTNTINGGPSGDANLARPLVQIRTSATPSGLRRIPKPNGPPNPQRFENLADAKVTTTRTLYFSEIHVASGVNPPSLHPPENDSHTLFYITVDGQRPLLFDPSNPPAITTTQGSVEDWIIQNRSDEVHEFHIHQIHFLLEEVNGRRVPKGHQQFYDTYQVGYWNDKSKKYPSIKVRMDFRGAVVGDFVYHCHILDHEDGGMMAIIRVLPKAGG
ncbi:MAG TPA: multicopper oxidase family protein [Rhizomicrobium sp.]